MKLMALAFACILLAYVIVAQRVGAVAQDRMLIRIRTTTILERIIRAQQMLDTAPALQNLSKLTKHHRASGISYS